MKILQLIALFVFLWIQGFTQDKVFVIKASCPCYSDKVVNNIKKQIIKTKLSKNIRDELQNSFDSKDYYQFNFILKQIVRLHKHCPKIKQLLLNLMKVNDTSLNRIIIELSDTNYLNIDYCTLNIDCNNIGLENNSANNIGLSEIQDTSDAHLGHIAHLVCFIQDETQALQTIAHLKTSNNIYGKFTYAQMLYKFKRYIECRKLLNEIIDDEISSMKSNQPKSSNYVYAGWSIELLRNINSTESHQKYKILDDLYSAALELYPDTYELHNVDSTNIYNNRFSIERAKYVLENTYRIMNCP